MFGRCIVITHINVVICLHEIRQMPVRRKNAVRIENHGQADRHQASARVDRDRLRKHKIAVIVIDA